MATKIINADPYFDAWDDATRNDDEKATYILEKLQQNPLYDITCWEDVCIIVGVTNYKNYLNSSEAKNIIKKYGSRSNEYTNLYDEACDQAVEEFVGDSISGVGIVPKQSKLGQYMMQHTNQIRGYNESQNYIYYNDYKNPMTDIFGLNNYSDATYHQILKKYDFIPDYDHDDYDHIMKNYYPEDLEDED